MKNPTLIVAILIFTAVIGSGVYSLVRNSSKSDSQMKNNESMMQKNDTSTNAPETMMKNDDNNKEDKKMTNDTLPNSRYVQYSKSNFTNTSDNRRVLFFYASWCPTCKPADMSFTQHVGKIPTDVTLIRVNYNDPETDQEEKDLAKKYGITYQHTFVQIDKTGKEVTKWNGGQVDELLSHIK